MKNKNKLPIQYKLCMPIVKNVVAPTIEKLIIEYNSNESINSSKTLEEFLLFMVEKLKKGDLSYD